MTIYVGKEIYVTCRQFTFSFFVGLGVRGTMLLFMIPFYSFETQTSNTVFVPISFVREMLLEDFP